MPPKDYQNWPYFLSDVSQRLASWMMNSGHMVSIRGLAMLTQYKQKKKWQWEYVYNIIKFDEWIMNHTLGWQL